MIGIGSPIATNGYKSFVSGQTFRNANSTAPGQEVGKNVFKDADRSVRYESAKRVLPFDTDNMFQHSVKARLETNKSPVSNNGSPLKETINKMQSTSGLGDLTDTNIS